MKKLLLITLLFGLIINTNAQSSQYQTIARNLFSIGALPEVYESSNGLTYFVERGVTTNNQSGRMVWSDGTAAGTSYVNTSNITHTIGIVNSTLYGIDVQNRLFQFNPQTGVVILPQRLVRASELCQLGNDYYFVSDSVSSDFVCIWKINAAGSLSLAKRMSGFQGAALWGTLGAFVRNQELIIIGSRVIWKYAPSTNQLARLYNLNYGWGTSPNPVLKLHATPHNQFHYFLHLGKVLRTDGTPSGTGTPPEIDSISTNSYSEIFRHNSNLVLLKSTFSFLRGGATGYDFYAISIDDSYNVASTRLNNGGYAPMYPDYGYGYPRYYSFLAFNQRLFLATSESVLNYGNAPITIWNDASPNNQLTFQRAYTFGPEKRPFITGLQELNGKLLLSVSRHESSSPSSETAGTGIGFFEYDTLTNQVSQLEYSKASLLKWCNGTLFGVSNGNLHTFSTCLLTHEKPALSQFTMDTISNSLRIRFDAPRRDSVETFEIYAIDSTNNIQSRLITGSLLATVTASNISRNYTLTLGLPANNGVYRYAIKAVSVFGSCYDTTAFIGTFNFCRAISNSNLSNLRPTFNPNTGWVNIQAELNTPNRAIDTVKVYVNGNLRRSFLSLTNPNFVCDINNTGITDTIVIMVAAHNPCNGLTINTIDSIIPPRCIAAPPSNLQYRLNNTSTSSTDCTSMALELELNCFQNTNFDVYVNGFNVNHFSFGSGLLRYTVPLSFNAPIIYDLKLIASFPNSTCPNDTLLTINDVTANCQNRISNTAIISPNPATNNVVLTLAAGELSAVVDVFDNQGSLILSLGQLNNNATINLSSLNAGIYFMRLRYSSNNEVIRFFKL